MIERCGLLSLFKDSSLFVDIHRTSNKSFKTDNNTHYTGAMFLEIVVYFALVIALPTLINITIGRYIDTMLHSEPWFLLGGFFLALAVSVYLVYRRIKELSVLLETKK